jgi:hypothetical protein
MAAQAAGSLQQEIDGGWVRDQDIEIEIKALFHHLGRNQDPACPRCLCAVSAEPSNDLPFPVQSIPQGAPCMEQCEPGRLLHG